MKQEIEVGLPGRRYAIQVGHGLLEGAGKAIAEATRASKCAIVTDQTVADLYLDVVENSCRSAGLAPNRIVLPPGEQTKDFDHLRQVLEALQAAEIARDDVVVALGGGVIGDLAGFAASILRRGVQVVQIPTTLLSQVDSSVGGKTGIDTRFGKNLVGAFHQPSLVVIDLAVLDSLPDREMRAGYAEIVKYGLIQDETFYAWLETEAGKILERNGEALRRAVTTSCRIKAGIVEADERETTGARALLNLGHTFGHAIEAAAGFSVLHGEAVEVGIIMALTLSQRFGFAELDRVTTHFKENRLPTSLHDLDLTLSADVLSAHMVQDKKVKQGKVAFVLSRAIGSAFVETGVEHQAVIDALRAGGAK